MKIVVLDGFTVVQNDLNWDGFKEYGEVVCYDRTDSTQIIDRVKDADMIITSKCIIDKEVMDNSPNLKYIGVIATGYNNVDIEYAGRKQITVTNIPAYSTDSVAQFTFALLLEATNQVGIHNTSVHNGEWDKSIDFSYMLTPQVELAGKTMGIAGFGNIGQKVALIAQAFGMDVLVYSSHMKESDNTENIKFVTLENLLMESDVVSLHCAMTEKNKEMINRTTIDLMKNDAIIINTSRGPLINTEDLAEALMTKRISAAALDVLPEEPPRSGSLLASLTNCIITPHIAWITKDARSRLIKIATDNVKFFLKGQAINKIKNM